MLDLSGPFNLSAFVATLAVIVVLALLSVDVFATHGKRIKTAAKAIGIIGIVLGAVAVFCCVTINTDLVTIRGMQAADVVLINWDAIAVVFGVEVPYIGRIFLVFTAPVMWALTGLEMVLSIALTVGGFLPEKKKEQSIGKQEQAVASPEPEQAEEEQIAHASLGENEEPTEVPDEEPTAAFDEEPLSDEEPQEETQEQTEEAEVASTDTAEFEAEDEQEPTDEEPQEEESAEEESAVAESAGTLDDTDSDGEMDEMLGIMDEINGVLDRSSSEIDPSEYFTDFIDGEDEQEDDYEEESEEETQDEREEAEETEEEEPIAETPIPEPEPEPTPEPAPEPAPTLEPEPEKREEEPRVAATEVVTRVVPKKPPQELSGFTTIKTEQSAAKNEQPPSDAKEAVLPRGGLPQSRRHILMNRRNVVNMFSEYLNSKTKEEKERIESSINTIILK